jgi:hypothetical protein
MEQQIARAVKYIEKNSDTKGSVIISSDKKRDISRAVMEKNSEWRSCITEDVL